MTAVRKGQQNGSLCIFLCQLHGVDVNHRLVVYVSDFLQNRAESGSVHCHQIQRGRGNE